MIFTLSVLFIYLLSYQVYMDLKHIKSCSEVYSLIQAVILAPPTIPPNPPLSSLVQCTVFGKPRGCNRAPCRHACSGSVAPSDLIAVNVTLFLNFFFLPSFSRRRGKRRAPLLSAPGCVSVHVLSSPCFTAGGEVGAGFAWRSAVLHVFIRRKTQSGLRVEHYRRLEGVATRLRFTF